MGQTKDFQDTSVITIAVDGPAGAGKGTICKYLAGVLGFHLLDSGAIYRTIALAIMRHGVRNPTDEFAVEIATEVVNTLTFDKDARVFVNGHCLGDQIRSAEVDAFTPKIAKIGDLRRAIKPFQLSMRKSPGLVADGRDMREIFEDPNCYGLFVTARAEVRAKRRLLDKRANPHGKLVYDEVLAAITLRDEEDLKREDGKLQMHKGVMLIDTSDMSVAQMCEYAHNLYKARKQAA